MFQNPTFKRPARQNLETLLQSLKAEILKEMNCVKIGVIKSFNPILQEAEVQIAFQQVTSIAPDGTQTIAQYPLLLNVPILFPAGGGFTLTFPVTAGDECIVLFNDRQIDNWVINGPGAPPSLDRVHDISDGIAIVGIRSNPRALGGVSSSTAQLRSDDGETYVELAGGGVVNIVAPTQMTITTPVLTITGVIDVQNVNSESTPCNVNGNIVTNGDVIASGISLNSHEHIGVTPGGGNTGGPI